jgi:hypothetical protein
MLRFAARVVVLTSLMALSASPGAHAERLELPARPATSPDVEDRLLNSLLPSTDSTATIELSSHGSLSAVVAQRISPHQSYESAEEVFTVLRHDASEREKDEVEKLLAGLRRICPAYPATIAKNDTGALLIERESVDCLRPGHRYTLSRFVRGAHGLYQLSYVARKHVPESTRAAWRSVLAAARIVP